MPQTSRYVFATHHGEITKVVDAPLRYVYDWCTDFRATDGKFTKWKMRFRVVRASPRRLVRLRFYDTRAGSPTVEVELVRLSPPNAWHKDTIGEEDLDSIDYTLRALGPRKTEVRLVIVERWMVPKFPSRVAWLRSSSRYWDELVQAIETRYRSGRNAKG